MSGMNPGFAAYLAKKKAGKGVTPPTTSDIQKRMAAMSAQGSQYPMVPMHPKMVASIKASPAGVLPAGLAKYLAKKKKGKK